MKKLYSHNESSSTSLNYIDSVLAFKWLQKPINEDLNYFTNKYRYQSISQDNIINTDAHDNFALDFSASNNNIKADSNTLIWYSFALSNLLDLKEKVKDKFIYSLVINYSLIPSVYKIYLKQKTNYFEIDVVSNKEYLSNEELKIFINEELNLSNFFPDINFYFNYFNSKEYKKFGDLVLIYKR